MRVRFPPTVVPMDCDPIDPDEGPVLLKLTSKGDLVFYNWDEEPDEAMESLGFPLEDMSKCYLIRKNQHDIVLQILTHLDGAYTLHGNLLPKKIFSKIEQTGRRLYKAADDAFKKTNYRKPSARWVDRAGVDFEVAFMRASGRAAAKHASVKGEVETVWHSQYGKRAYPGKLLEVELRTTPSLYIELLNKIPDGVIYDPKKDAWYLAAAIVKRISRDSMIVKAGKQGRGLSIDDRAALVNKDGEGDWVVKRWL